MDPVREVLFVGRERHPLTRPGHRRNDCSKGVSYIRILLNILYPLTYISSVILLTVSVCACVRACMCVFCFCDRHQTQITTVVTSHSHRVVVIVDCLAVELMSLSHSV